ncbi:MAG: hypothetical protein J5586_06615, partial [Clostridia bacterium]|nr:hypothetical protein [Clostridia bacterium]
VSKEEIFAPIEAKSAGILVSGLSSIFNEEGRKKIPFEAVYPYVNAPKALFLFPRLSRDLLFMRRGSIIHL